MKRVVIVGAGVTGLTAAYWLERKTEARITLIDSPRPGGKLMTERLEGFTLDLGPDSIFVRKPAAMELIDRLEISRDVVEPQSKEFSIFVDGKLHRVPAGLASLGSISPEAVDKADLLSEEAKRRVKNTEETVFESDVSVAEFFRAKYGEEFSARLAEPLLAGTHAGDPWKLSMRALYPGYLQATKAATSGGPTFVSFQTGIARLTEILYDRLNRTDFSWSWIDQVRRGPTGLIAGEAYADHVLLAIPSNQAAPVIQDLAAEAAEEMAAIRHASSAIVTLAFQRAAIDEPEGTGFLVPIGEDCPITGATWTSNKWPNRSPENAFLTRVFLGRDGEQDVTNLVDDELVERAKAGLLQTAGIDAEPILTRISRWHEALPQYEIGHLGRVRRIREALSHLPITVAGTSYGGVGIADCIRQGREAADEIAKRLEQ